MPDGWKKYEKRKSCPAKLKWYAHQRSLRFQQWLAKMVA